MTAKCSARAGGNKPAGGKGGTGRFEDARGGFSTQLTETIEPTENPLVSIGSASYSAIGTIHYSVPATIRK